MNLIPRIPGDDPILLRSLDRFFEEIAEHSRPDELVLTRIAGWFDHKWLGFAGKAKVGIETGLPSIDSEVRPAWKAAGDVTVPPFVPSRIFVELHYRFREMRLEVYDPPALVHHQTRRRSALNLRHRLLNNLSSAELFWFSSHSAESGRASLMNYTVRDGRVKGWYVSFLKKERWRVNRTKNIDRAAVVRVFTRLIEQAGKD
jgi:hypothetical protein